MVAGGCTSFTKGVRPSGKTYYDVVYVGMATQGIRGRLESHVKRKGDLWTHFSAFEVWDNIRDEEIVELEGLFRHLYRKDSRPTPSTSSAPSRRPPR